MADKNLLIGFGETLTGLVDRSTGGGAKAYPYSFAQARQRLQPQLNSVTERMNNVPAGAAPGGRYVASFTLHPAFMAKSYYPEYLFERAGLSALGSRGVCIQPEVVTNRRAIGKQASTLLYIAGTSENFAAFSSMVDGRANKTLQREISQLESISYFDPATKIKPLKEGLKEHRLEVVLHIGGRSDVVIGCFREYASTLECNVDFDRSIRTGGLLFLPVEASIEAIPLLAEYTHLRVVREMADLRIQKPNIFRHTSAFVAPDLPTAPALNQEVRVAVFDGGIGVSDFNTWCTEHTYSSKPTNASYLAHGQEVSSAILFGHLDGTETELQIPISNIDHYRVIDPTTHHDPDLFDVLNRIKDALTSKNYDFANISLGPRLPIEDDDVHAWTAVLDSVIANTGTFLSVAIGNDGDMGPDLNRIQPPADMVNGFAVGAADKCDDGWQRAPYSCVGPGRSPGLVKPDGIAFGGSIRQPMKLVSPMAGSVVETAGTSFASPLALRMALQFYNEVATTISPLTAKSMMIHEASDNGYSRNDVGWGLFPASIEQLTVCGDTEVKVFYQGQLEPGKCLRAPIPFPDLELQGNVTIKATFCYFSHLDPEHSGNYTRSGLEVVFRNDARDLSATTSFFKQKDMYESEQEARSDAHKWETTLKNEKSFRKTSVHDPCFDITYHTREKSHATTDEPLDPLPYVLIVTVSQPKTPGIYNNILQRYQTLQPIQLRQQVQVKS